MRFSKRISDEVKVRSPEVHDFSPPYYPDTFLHDLELHPLMVTAAKVVSNFHIPKQTSLVHLSESLAVYLSS